MSQPGKTSLATATFELVDPEQDKDVRTQVTVLTSSMEPPFTHVGVDVFGPWTISARRTRGGHAESKRWAILFTSLSTRAIHLEVIESMDSSSFINALRRFLAIHGPVKKIRSDRGANFIRACKDLVISSNVDENVVKRYLSEKGCTWTFNLPHSSHMGGVWARMISITRKILDSMLLQLGPPRLTYEVLTTFMAEVMANVSNRPLVPVSTDAQDPFILTPYCSHRKAVLIPFRQVSSTTRTCTSDSGGKSKVLPVHSGTDGRSNTCPLYSCEGNGHPVGQTSHQDLWCS